MKQLVNFLLLSLVFIIFACKRKDQCELNACPTNAICNDGKCECENSYKVKDACITKNPNTFYYAGSSSYNCVPDTFTLEITPDITDPKHGNYTYNVPFGNSASTFSGGLDYFKLPDGDSIRSIVSLEVIKKCYVNGKDVSTEVLGKYKGSDRLDLTVRFFELSNYSKTIDSYKITMKK